MKSRPPPIILGPVPRIEPGPKLTAYGVQTPGTRTA